jgi:hypothetical protein
MWDGKGFADRAVEDMKIYATYKLALYLVALKKTETSSPIASAVFARLRALQNDAGGWITDYDRELRPRGFANVETTCMALLALQAHEK